MKSSRWVFLLVMAIPSLAQYPGTYPPGRYPGGGYPYPGGGGVGGLPIPGRGRKTTKSKQPEAPMPSFTGNLKQLEDKKIVLELEDNRVLDFTRNDKTKLLKNGNEAAKAAEFKPGSRISIEATEDAEGFLTAVNVRLEKLAAPAKTDAGAPATKAESSAPPPKTDGSVPAAKTEGTAPAPAAAAKSSEVDAKAVEDEDPNRPRLRRGKPAKRSTAADEDEDKPVIASAQPPAAPGGETVTRPEPTVERIDTTGPKEDPLIVKAKSVSESFSETLPNYVCQEFMSRYYSTSSKADWQPIDVVSTDVVYEDGKESYKNLKINGKAAGKGMEEMKGAWSTGEFGTVLRDLFSPMTAARFVQRRQTTIAGRSAVVFDFNVDRENSHWLVKVGSQSIEPAYRGSVWVDRETARVLRIEMQAVNLPETFPVDHVESATDYEFVRLAATSQFLLPVHAESLSCQRGSNQCSRNKIDFRNYHKYSGESNITFDETKK